MAQKPDPPQNQEFIYQPKWKGRKVVRHFITALAIGGLTLSLHYVYKKTDQGWSRDTVITGKPAKGSRDQFVALTVIFITSGATFTIPSNALSAQIDCIGGGASGTSGTAGGNAGNVNNSAGTGGTGGNGGGGGAWSRLNALAVSPNAVVSCQVGGIGGDTWFVSTATVLAKGASGTSGGASGSGVGDVKAGGGNAAAGAAGQGPQAPNGLTGGNGGGGGGGGGAAGPSAVGGSGSGTSGGTGGGVGGGASGGGAGTNFDGSHGAGGGGNGGGGGAGAVFGPDPANNGSPGSTGGVGGLYGAGGGGGGGGGGGAAAAITAGSGGAGAGGNSGTQGIIAFSFIPLIAGFSIFDPPAPPKNWPLNIQNRNAQQRDFQMFLPAPGLPNQQFGYDFYQWPNAPRPINFAKDWIAFSGNLIIEQATPVGFQFTSFSPGLRSRNFSKDWIEYDEIGYAIVQVNRLGIDFTPFSPGLAAKLWTRYGQQPQWWTYEFKAPLAKKRDKHDSGDWIPRYRSHPTVYEQSYYDELDKKWTWQQPSEEAPPAIAPPVPNLRIPLTRIISPVHIPSLHQAPPHRPVPSLTTNPPPFHMATPEQMASDDEHIIRMLLEE